MQRVTILISLIISFAAVSVNANDNSLSWSIQSLADTTQQYIKHPTKASASPQRTITPAMSIRSLSKQTDQSLLDITLQGISYSAKIANIKSNKFGKIYSVILQEFPSLPRAKIFVYGDSLNAWIPTLLGTQRIQNNRLVPQAEMFTLTEESERQHDIFNKGLSATKRLPSQSELRKNHVHANEVSALHAQDSNSLQTLSPEFEEALDSDEMVTIRSLFFITNEYAALRDEPEARINELVEISNEIYRASGIKMQVEIADIVQLDFEAFNSSQIGAVMTAYIDPSDYGMSQELVDTFNNAMVENKADTVTFFYRTSISSSICGLGYFPNTEDMSDGNLAAYNFLHEFALTDLRCGETDFAHEVGHNIGLAHSFAQGSTGVFFDYARGHGVQNKFVTTMAYQSAYDAPRVPLFSSPELDCTNDAQTLPCGIAEGKEASADAVTATNALRFRMANIYNESDPFFLLNDAMPTIQDSELQRCIQTRVNSGNRFEPYTRSFSDLRCNAHRDMSSLDGLENFTGITSAVLRDTKIDSLTPLMSSKRLSNMSIINNVIFEYDGVTNERRIVKTGKITSLEPIADLTNLMSVNMRGHPISSVTPLDKLKRLTSLDLSYSQADDYSVIAGLGNLSYLTLNDTGLTDASFVSSLSRLQALYLNDNALTTLPNLTSLTALRYLQLNYNQLNDIEFVSLLNTLQSLDAGNNQITQLPNLSNLGQLETLVLSANQIVDIAPLANLTRLSELGLFANEVSNIDALRYLSSLSTLILTGNNIDSVSALKRLNQLRQLYLESNPIEDYRPLASLLENGNLEVLAISGSKISCGDVNAIRSYAATQLFLSGVCLQRDDDDLDNDNDGISNLLDTDDDNDGINDFADALPYDASNQNDADNDGVENAQDAFPFDNTEQIDTDADGFGNNEDNDDDNDGVLDEDDAFPLDARYSKDTDRDGIADPIDLSPNGVATAYDFDGDGKADIAVRRASSSQQFILSSLSQSLTTVEFGSQSTDIPVSGDFDGDQIVDIAFRRPDIGLWVVLNSSGSDFNSDRGDDIQRVQLGHEPSDVPVNADYDGDGIDDFAVRRVATSQWIIRYSSTGEIKRTRFGLQSKDIAVPADYDGDGKADIAIRRPNNATWYIKQSSDQQVKAYRFGLNATDIPVPADYDGDGKADLAVRRPLSGQWFIRESSTQQVISTRFGLRSSDVPIVADYDGDKRADIAIRRPSDRTQYIKNSQDDSISRVRFGLDVNDIPFAASTNYRIRSLRSENQSKNQSKIQNAVIKTELPDTVIINAEQATIEGVIAR